MNAYERMILGQIESLKSMTEKELGANSDLVTALSGVLTRFNDKEATSALDGATSQRERGQELERNLILGDLRNMNGTRNHAFVQEDADEDDRDYYDDDDYYNDEYVAPEAVPPAGLSKDEYDAFLANNVPGVGEHQDTNEVAEGFRDVVGVFVVEDGTTKEFGSIEDSVAQMNEAIASVEEEGAIEDDGMFIVTYTREDGQELTNENVRRILAHPVSASLKHLGKIQLIDIQETEEASSRKVRFGVLEQGEIALKGLRINAAAYRGVQVFPGIGSVKAIGTVNV